MSKVEFDYDGEHYILEFDRDTVAAGEQVFGISLNAIRELQLSTFPALFKASFLKHHPRISNETMDAIYDQLPKKQDLFMELAKMYAEAINTLFEDPAKGKSISWTMS